jgi:hypothetical protein
LNHRRKAKHNAPSFGPGTGAFGGKADINQSTIASESVESDPLQTSSGDAPGKINDQRMRARNAASAFANCRYAVAHVRGSYVPKVAGPVRTEADKAFAVPFIGDVPMQGFGRKPQQTASGFCFGRTCTHKLCVLGPEGTVVTAANQPDQQSTSRTLIRRHINRGAPHVDLPQYTS